MKIKLPDSIRFGRDICGDLAQAERREWWLANGRGAYASGTIAGTLTRRYHGLLVAPLDPPLGRYLVVAKADATFVAGDRQWPLFSNRWNGGVIDPLGHEHIESFRLEGRMPVWRFVLDEWRLEMRLWMEPYADTVYVAYRLDGGNGEAVPAPELHVRLLVNARDHHGNTARGPFWPAVTISVPENNGDQTLLVNTPRVSGHGGYTLYFNARGGRFVPDGTWHENFDLPVERERGLPSTDNHLSAGEARLRLKPGEWVGVTASLHADASPYLEEALRRFLNRERNLLVGTAVRAPEFAQAPDWIRQLVLAADSFLFHRPAPGSPEGESVIAGYPWFGDWGRDTMIALPGLTLATGRYESAQHVLETFAGFIDQGMLPNVFPGEGTQPEYNTADAALWYIEAWRAFHAAYPDTVALKRVYPVLEDIVARHARGTRYGIGMDPADGLMRAGESGVQITWMDAKIGDWVVTPRIGKPVEINSLWYNALCAMAEFAGQLGHDSDTYRAMAETTRRGFQRFIHPVSGALYDVLDGPDGHDDSIRPNQIFAISLPHSPLAPATQRRVLDQCARHLFTSYGLRSLSPVHPDYRPRYEGGVWERDGSYHQGPVWGWLLGHYALAHHRVHGDAAAAQQLLEPIRDHLFDAGLGTVSEIFDGAAPHTPRGAPAQAWSVACVLEAWHRLERARQAHAATTPIREAESVN
jgi:4-alpha-glucanotransferase